MSRNVLGNKQKLHGKVKGEIILKLCNVTEFFNLYVKTELGLKMVAL